MRSTALTNLLFPVARIKIQGEKRGGHTAMQITTPKETPAVCVGGRNVVLEHAVTGGANGDPSGIPIRNYHQ